MKADRLTTALLAALLAFCTAIGAAGCMISGFGLSITSWPQLILCCAGACLLCALGFSVKFGCIPLLLTGGYLLYRLILQGELTQQFWQLLYRITYLYNNAYHWGYFQLVNTPWNAGIADLPMTVLAVSLAAIIVWTVCRQGYGLPACASGLLPLLVCCVITDTVPDAKFLFLLLFPLTILLLSSRVRRADPYQGNRLTILALLPVLLVLGLLFHFTPEERYVNRSSEFRDKVLTWFREIPEKSQSATPQVNISTYLREPQSLNLSSLGRRIESSTPVMAVTADVGGTLYLRGQDYDTYDGFGWTTSSNRVEDFSYPGVDLGHVTVETVTRLDQLYLPYYPKDAASLIGGRVDNSRLETAYTFSRTGFAEDLNALVDSVSRRPEHEARARYLSLPETTRPGAEALIAQILSGETTATDKAAAIAAFVRSRAEYDLDPSRMPEGEPDFALWFLEDADRGYCIHFATAATVLLRSAGIEARYVSGYMVEAPAAEAVTLTGEHAHAWAEYYEPLLGTWLVLEATPADTPQPLPPVTVPDPEPSEETTPSATETAPSVTEEPASATETAPAATVGSSQSLSKPDLGPLKTAAKILLWLALLIVLLEGQARLRRHLRSARRRKGSPNAQALYCWQEAELLAKLLKEVPPKRLENLAQKAKFSQHTLSAEELAAFDSYLQTAKTQLKQTPWYRKLVHRYLLAVV